jgi:hypothetical protein
MTPSDADLERQLAEGLRGATPELPDRPSPERLAALRAHVQGGSTSPGAIPARRERRTWPTVAAAAAVALLGFVGGLVAADGLPDPVRSAAVAVGLPVDPPEVVATVDAVQALGVALDAATVAAVRGDLDAAALEAVAEADSAMLAAIREVEPADLVRLRPVAHQVHLRAVALFASQGEQLPAASPVDLQEIEETSPSA